MALHLPQNTLPTDIPLLTAQMNDVQNQSHVAAVHSHLVRGGVLKITLGFKDTDSRYIEKLIHQLHRYHGHGLPIDHSSSRGWFWDVRPSPQTIENGHQARSHTMGNFAWHTDCSYETSPPRYFALQVLEPDRCGGGTLSVLKSDQLLRQLPPPVRVALAKPEFRITVPPEFIKNKDETHIIGSVFAGDLDNRPELRFRQDIITPLTSAAEAAFSTLQAVLKGPQVEEETIHLTAQMMQEGSVILMDNRRWLHSRNHIKDPNRHVRRVRWDASPF
ncbi:hypothetical protein ASPWEDRAFT_136814 [Aspergillus wentii DTO 134E9]|uniref:TauD/TfdA-like domain-containing protein n=1 Tax=Aspergillus wentii DTO 134E9 TaxID=1073089 RepID=A0A1L9RI57_ASPWE|nr:uncharacterized protein ASPWEDRAFT_136814 [Aspergillus wentii DTO 134E9]OJJ34609.1 hypothetical protein ASPWEDRAFT_136814 [Aspergillus wentii DTO 134E9]